MAKTINLEFEGKSYTLEFTRKSVETMERRGFKISDISDKPVSTLPALFAGAFLANHRFIKQEIVDKIFNCISNRDELLSKLSEMYNEPIEAMLEGSETDEGNATWGASW